MSSQQAPAPALAISPTSLPMLGASQASAITPALTPSDTFQAASVPRETTSSAELTAGPDATPTIDSRLIATNEDPTVAQGPLHISRDPATITRDDFDRSNESTKKLVERMEEKQEQARAIRDTPNHVLESQLERVLIRRRKERGEPEAPTLVPGLHDSTLWSLRRRFDLEINHVLTPPLNLPSGEPDLRPSPLPDVPFRPNVLKSNTERVFASLVFKGFIFVREMHRIRLWTTPERPRTLRFCLAYTIFWASGLLIPALLSFLILLIVFPQTRTFFFPHAVPESRIPVPPKTPTAYTSFLLSVPDPALYQDKLELLKDYAVEGGKIVQRLVRRVWLGGFTELDEGNGRVGKKHGRGSSWNDEQETRDTGGNEAISRDRTAEAKAATGGVAPVLIQQLEAAKADWNDEHRDVQASKLAKGLQDALGVLADSIEILQNALSPPEAYPDHNARLRLAAILAPGVIIIPFIPAWVWSYGIGAAIGIAFFGEPLLRRATRTIVKNVPNWQELLNPRDTIFSGVPTNMQLTLHLLRINEAHHHPLPPPPDPPTDAEVKEQLDDTDSTYDAPEITDELAGVIVKPDEEIELNEDQEEREEEEEKKHGAKKWWGKLVKKAAKTAAGEGKTIGQARQKAGEKVDRKFFQSNARDDGANNKFACRYKDVSGHLQLSVSPSEHSSTITFTPASSSDVTTPTSASLGLNIPTPTTFALDDLVEVKKLGVSKKELALSLAANFDVEGKRLEMRFKTFEERKRDKYGKRTQSGDVCKDEQIEGRLFGITAVTRRDELFARLIAIPRTKWEVL